MRPYTINSMVVEYIKFAENPTLPGRKEFEDEALRQTYEEKIKNGETVPFLINSHLERADYISGKNTHAIYLVGVLPHGAKAIVVLTGFPIYVDIRLAKDKTVDQLKNEIRDALLNDKLYEGEPEVVPQYSAMEFSIEPFTYVRLHSKNLFDRAKIITWAHGRGYQTAHDDNTGMDYYFRVVAREYKFNTAGWNDLRAYDAKRVHPGYCDIIHNESLNMQVSWVFKVNIKNFTAAKYADNWAKNDRMISMAWDIETQTAGKMTDEIPSAEDRNTHVFMFGINFYWHYTDKAFMRVLIADKPIREDNIKFAEIFYDEEEDQSFSLAPRNIIIEVANERDIVLCFTELFRKMSPDFTPAFNSGGFDNKYLFERFTRHNLSHTCFQKYSAINLRPSSKFSSAPHRMTWTEERVKIAADTDMMKPLTMKSGSSIDIDVLIVFRKIYPKDETNNKYSLNTFCKLNGIPGKEDMPYKDMHDYYDRGINMDLIGKYCLVDAHRCWQLMVRKSIIQEKRSNAIMSFTSLYDAVIRADGGKVINYVAAFCSTFNIAFSMQISKNQKIKFAGAHVFVPNKAPHGIEEDRGITGLDFNSLYPSLMMAYNFSPDKTIANDGRQETLEYVAKLKVLGYILHEIKFGGVVNDKGDPENGSEKIFCGWSVRHNMVLAEGDKPKGLDRDALPGEMMGVFPQILIKLKNERGKVKKIFTACEKLIEKINSQRELNAARGLPEDDMSEIPDAMITAATFTRENMKMEDIVFLKGETERIQKAIKVLMNTFYGKQGDSTGPIYKLVCAGAIPNEGQYNIKMVASHLQQNSFDIIYGDTDSNYIKVPWMHLARYLELYNREMDRLEEILIAGGCERLTHTEHKLRLNVAKDAGFRSFIHKSDFMIGYFAEYEDMDKRYKAGKIGGQALDDENYARFKNIIARINAAADEYMREMNDGQRLSVVLALRYVVREEYLRQNVQITRRAIDKTREEINSLLASNNGTGYLTMAYEEILLPAIFIRKKKYLGIQHMDTENFFPKKEKEYFVKGVDPLVKKGQTELGKKLTWSIVKEALSIENELELMTIIENKIREIYETNWEEELFILTAKYRPTKQNVAVKTFVSRMQKKYDFLMTIDPVKAAMYKPPEAGDSFKYIIAQKEHGFDLAGHKIKYQKGDKMEYVDVFKAEGMKYDLQHYMKGSIIATLASFISYRKEFNTAPSTADESAADKIMMANATKYIAAICDKYAGIDKAGDAARGVKVRSSTKNINKQLEHNLPRGFSQILAGFGDGNDSIAIIAAIEKRNQELAANFYKGYGDRFLAEYKPRFEKDREFFYKMRGYYDFSRKLDSNRIHILNREIKLIKDKLSTQFHAILRIVQQYNENAAALTMDMREILVKGAEIPIENYNKYINFSQEDLAKIAEFHEDLQKFAAKIFIITQLSQINLSFKSYKYEYNNVEARHKVVVPRNSTYEVIPGLTDFDC